MLKFFDTRPVDAFATLISVEVVKLLPPKLIEGGSKSADKKRGQLEERLRRQVERLLVDTTLNIYQKAKLGTVLQEKLRGQGYPEDFARAFSSDMVRLVALTASRR